MLGAAVNERHGDLQPQSTLHLAWEVAVRAAETTRGEPDEAPQDPEEVLQIKGPLASAVCSP